jgi:hypothetical protein
LQPYLDTEITNEIKKETIESKRERERERERGEREKVTDRAHRLRQQP